MTRLHVSPISGDGALIYRSGNALAYLVGVPVSSLDKVAARLANAEPVAWMAVLQAFQVTGAAVIDESNERTRLRYTGMVEIQVLNGSTHPNEPDGSLYVGNDDVRIMHLSVDDRLRINPRPDAMGIGNLEGGSMAVDSLFIRVGEFEEATTSSDAGSTAAPGPSQVRASIPLPPISTATSVVPPGDEVFEPDPTVFHVPLHGGANEAQVIDIAGQTSPGTVDVSPPDVTATLGSGAAASPVAAPSGVFVVEPPDAQAPSTPEVTIVDGQPNEAAAPPEAESTDADDADAPTVEHVSIEPDSAEPDHPQSERAESGAAESGADTAEDDTADAADDTADAAEAERDGSETTATDEGSTNPDTDDSASEELEPEVEAIEPAVEAAQITVVEVDEAEPIKAHASEPDAAGSDTDTDTSSSREADADDEEVAATDDEEVAASADESTASTDKGTDAVDASGEATNSGDASDPDDAEVDGSDDVAGGHDGADAEVDDGDDTSDDEPDSSTKSTSGADEGGDDNGEKPKTDGDNDNAADSSSEPAPTVFIGAPAKTEKSGFDAPYQPSFKKVPLITKSNEAVVVTDEAADAEATEPHDERQRSKEAASDPSPSDQTCVNGHRNTPTAALCSTCGERLNTPAEGGRVFMRPGVVGTLTFDDGEHFDISNDLLVGRAPGTPVIGDTAEFPSDPMMSREHFRIEVDDQSVIVRDLNSSNGTMVRFASDGGYERLLPGEAYPLSDGAVIVAGQRWATFALHVG